MSFHALTRSILFATSLLTGLGQSMDALAHGVAHAHEAEHRGSVAQPESHAHQQQDVHREQHQHREQHKHNKHHKNDEQHKHHEPLPEYEAQQHNEPPKHDEPQQHSSELLHPELTQPDHQHDHVHAIVDAGLKSRADLVPFLVASPPALRLAPIAAVKHESPHAGSTAPPPERRHTSASPRAPPSR